MTSRTNNQQLNGTDTINFGMKRSQKQKRVLLDELDMKLISLLIQGYDNKQIAKNVKSPLSTIQRRTRKLFEAKYVVNNVELNFQKLGYHKGYVHLYLHGGTDMNVFAERLRNMKGIYSVGLHLGNSDIVGTIVFKENREVLDLIADVKKLEGISRIIWSHEVYTLPGAHSKFEELTA